jgi:fused signal recognition particle receptor
MRAVGSQCDNGVVELLIPIVIGLLLVVVVGFFLVRGRGGAPKAPPETPDITRGPGAGEAEPGGTPAGPGEEAPSEGSAVGTALLEPTAPLVEQPAPALGRMGRLRARLSRSNNAIGRGLLLLLSSDNLDDDTWEEIEDTLLMADLGVPGTQDLVARLKERVRVEGVDDPAQLRIMLEEELLISVDPDMDRELLTLRVNDMPAVVLIVGVNGTGKTTTTGKLARLLVAEDRDVLLAAADTFRAAASEQLQTWGERVGVPVVRGPESADPASVAFDAVSAGIELEVDTVVVDTAGRLHTKVGLMDQLGKVKRVIEKKAPVTEVLLVLDATTGQNGMNQARIFSDVVDVTGIVLTKLDGTAKGGIVVAVQQELGVPVKLVGLGEGPDDLAPFEPETFVKAIIEG